MSVLIAELAIGLFTIFRFTRIIDSGVVLLKGYQLWAGCHGCNRYSRRRPDVDLQS